VVGANFYLSKSDLLNSESGGGYIAGRRGTFGKGSGGPCDSLLVIF